MAGLQLDRGRLTCFIGFDPACHAEAPEITGLQAREVQLWQRCDQVIAHFLREIEKFRRHLRAYRMLPQISGRSMAKAIAEITGNRIEAAA